jgi:uncharacterized protein (DUF983 family)
MSHSGETIHPWIALKNGLRKTCPHCGLGPMLDGWLSCRDRCPECGLVYQRNPGDTWGFWIIGDRIPVAIAIAAVYFGLGPHTWIQGASFFGVMAILMIVTVPQRLGFVVALHYLSRRYWPDPDDPIPPTFSSDRTELSETFRPASASPRPT